MVTIQRSGSFHALREQHLPLFDQKVRRHDRGWPHPSLETREAQPAKRPWNRAGIFHFRHDEEGDN